MRVLCFLFIFIVSTYAFGFEYIQGKLELIDGSFHIVNNHEVIPITTSTKIKKSLSSLETPSFVTQSNHRKYTFEFKGKRTSKGFKLDQVPTNIAGPIGMKGFLLKDEATNQYLINGYKAIFGYTKKLNGHSFDEISKNFFIGQKVFAEGYLDEDGIFVINAVTPENLFSASRPTPLPDIIQRELDDKGTWKFIFNSMNKNKFSQIDDSFRTTIYTDKKNPVAIGDDFLVITLGGRQGDTFGSVNGHMVAGIGVVKEDMDLRGEVSNAYVTNGKDILSGNVSLTNYFSHLVQGQNIYRPTYTFIAYGVDKKKLKIFRDALESSHIKFRTTKLDITPQFNCTTETIKALNKAGINGHYRKWDNTLMRYITYPLIIFGEVGEDINYTFGNDASIYQPRPAFESFARVFLKDKARRALGIKRVDYIFYAQTPSNRPIGGAANKSKRYALRFKRFYEKYEVSKSTKLSPEKLRPLLERKLQIIE